AVRVHFARERAIALVLLFQEIVQPGRDGLAAVELSPLGRWLLRLAGGEEWEQAKRGSGDIVLTIALSLAVAGERLARHAERLLAGVLAEAAQRPVAIAGLMQGQPLQPPGDGCFRAAVAAADLDHALSGGAAAAAETSRHKDAAHAAGSAEQVPLAEFAGHDLCLAGTAARAGRQRQSPWRRFGSIRDAGGGGRIGIAGDADAVDLVHGVLSRDRRIKALVRHGQVLLVVLKDLFLVPLGFELVVSPCGRDRDQAE